MTKRIEKAVKELHMENQQMFTMRELQAIAKLAKASTVDVMYYLRYQRA